MFPAGVTPPTSRRDQSARSEAVAMPVAGLFFPIFNFLLKSFIRLTAVVGGGENKVEPSEDRRCKASWENKTEAGLRTA